MTEILKGKDIADKINAEVKKKCDELKLHDIVPTLAIFQVGSRPEDNAYKKGIMARAEKTGIEVREIVLPEDSGTEQVLNMLMIANHSVHIHGILLMRPMPSQIDEAKLIETIDPRRDVDGATDASLTSIYKGEGPGFAPCTAEATLEIAKSCVGELKAKRVTVVGRSMVIGKPVAMMFLHEDATVKVCHSKTANLAQETREADIVVVAAGKAGMIDASFLRSGQAVIDVGINESEGKIVGDVKFDEADGTVDILTPVPGGVGSVTSSILMKHVLEAAYEQTDGGAREFEPDALDLAKPEIY